MLAFLRNNWPRLANALLGLWLMAAPAVIGFGGIASKNSRVVGPMAFSFAVIAVFEPTRPLRWLNLLLGAWLAVSPFVLGYNGATSAAINTLAAGLLLFTFALVRGTITSEFGGGWSSLWSEKGS